MDKYRDRGLSLLDADTEMAVRELLSKPVYEDVDWKPLGGQENNYGIVENQAGIAMAALTEIIVNSIDASLLKHYHEQYGDSNKMPEFSTMAEAAADLFGDNIQPEPIVIGAEGEQRVHGKNVISPVIEDKGQGKNQDNFRETFLGLLEPGINKQEYEFLQGQYGMGSTGVLPFCGEKGYKLIVSAGVNSPNEWSWSLIRKNRRENRYEFLTFGGDIPTFNGEVRGQTYGTFVKLYDYQISQRSNVTSKTNLRRFLERYLWDIPIPVVLDERRQSFESLGQTTTKGGLEHIENDLSNIVQRNYFIEQNFDSEILGTRNIHVIVFKKKSSLSKSEQRDWQLFLGGDKHDRQAVFFIVNGQTHGDEGKAFIKTQCELPQVSKDALFLVDFSDIRGADLVDLFKPSRDRLKSNQIADDLLEGIKDALQNDAALAELEAERRTRYVSEREDVELEVALTDMISETPELYDLFKSEGDISFDLSGTFTSRKVNSGTTGQVTAYDYDPPFIPDMLNIIETYRSRTDYDIWGEDEFYKIEVPINRAKRLRLELNAPNDYFERDNSPGKIHVTPDEIVKSRQLTDGILSFRLQAMPHASPGDQYSATIEVTRPSGDSLKHPFKLQHTEAIEKKDTDSTGTREIAFQPQIFMLEENELEDQDMAPDDIIEIHDYLNSEGMLEFYVNIDAPPLKQFKVNHDVDAPEEVINRVYARSISLFAATQYFRIKDEFQDVEVDTTDVVNRSMQGIVRAIFATVVTPENLSAES